MSDLDQLLAGTFERRAAVAPLGLSPEAVRREIRRHRVRSAKTCAVVTALVAAVGGAASAIHHTGRATQPAVRPVQPSPEPQVSDGGNGVVAARLPWGKTQQLTLAVRIGTYRGAMFCLPQAQVAADSLPDAVPGCTDEANLAATTPVDAGSQGRIFGIAPPGTAKVQLVLDTLQGRITVKAELAQVRSGAAPAPVVFGFPGRSSELDANGVLSLSSELEAFDVHGAVLGLSRRLGSVQLAAAHPATAEAPNTGAVATLPVEADYDQLHRVWTAADGWSCIGDRATVGGVVRWGAQECAPPFRPGDVTLLFAKYGTATDVPVLRMPTSVTACTLTEKGGRTDRATLTDTGRSRIAVLRTAANRSSAATLRCVNNMGTIAYEGRLDQLPRPATGQIVVAGLIP